MDSIQGASLQGVETLSTSVQSAATSYSTPSIEFESLLSDVNLEYLTSSLSLSGNIKLGSLLEISQQNAELEDGKDEEFQSLDSQRAADIYSSAKIMKAILSF